MKGTNNMVIGIVIIVILVLLVIIGFSIYNKLQRLRLQVDQSAADIDVQLKKRYDLIPNLMETVKGSVNAERGTLTKVTALRDQMKDGIDNKDYDKAIKASNQLSRSINVTMEAYPQLQSNSSFTSLMETMTTIANQISACQSAYNSSVTNYNLAIVSIPSSWIANMMHLKQVDKLVSASTEEQKNVNVNFDDLK
ncbi:LemA family protein [Lactobacillus sp. S2-2]|uniref:LemA family protein n=1 Tax=Lactobacillus sp. S2-2 TaxID=2692917 RepID=UPI001F2D4EF8|nr:LemA family protein [Lactobacillus sp. S2-2]MCF6514570.1 LemA family protein [Lactobacillus sp. S2-2]